MRKTSKGTKPDRSQPDTSKKDVIEQEKKTASEPQAKQANAAAATDKNDKKTAAPKTPAKTTAKPEAPKSAAKKPAAESAAPAPKKGGGKLIGTVALLVALGAIYSGYQHQQQASRIHAGLTERLDTTEQTLSGIDGAVKDALSTAQAADSTAQASQTSLQGLQGQSDEIKASLAQLEAKVGSASTALSDKEAAIQAQVSALNQQITELSQQLQSQQQTPDASKTDWLVAEVTQLIKMANQQAQLAGNAQAAAAALETANARLGEINDPSLLNVRKILTDKIVALRGAPRVDVTTIALTLSSLEGEADKLPLKSTAPSSYQGEAHEEAGSEESSDLAGFFDKVWQDVKGLITIKQSGEDAAPALLPPGQQFFLQQNLRLKLETARLALLQGDTQLFQASIKTARQWLERYFDTSATATANMLTTLSPYESMELTTSLPDAGDALKALEKWQSLRHQTATSGQVTEAMEVAQS